MKYQLYFHYDGRDLLLEDYDVMICSTSTIQEATAVVARRWKSYMIQGCVWDMWQLLS